MCIFVEFTQVIVHLLPAGRYPPESECDGFHVVRAIVDGSARVVNVGLPVRHSLNDPVGGSSQSSCAALPRSRLGDMFWPN